MAETGGTTGHAARAPVVRPGPAAAGSQRSDVRVVADEPLMADALVALLSQERWLAVSKAQSIAEAYCQVRHPTRGAVVALVERADAVVFRALSDVRDRLPTVGLCLITDHVDGAALASMLRTSPSAFALLRPSSRPTRRDVLIALYALTSGRVLLPPGDVG